MQVKVIHSRNFRFKLFVSVFSSKTDAQLKEIENLKSSLHGPELLGYIRNLCFRFECESGGDQGDHCGDRDRYWPPALHQQVSKKSFRESVKKSTKKPAVLNVSYLWKTKQIKLTPLHYQVSAVYINKSSKDNQFSMFLTPEFF